MSINETEFVDFEKKFLNNDLNIKVESYCGDGRNPEDEFSASESKCGDIFHSTNGLFVFCCYYCSERFAAIEEFVSHFEGKHANTLITTKIDATPRNSRKVDKTNEYLGSEASETLPWTTDNPIKIEENLDSGNCISTDLFNEDETNVEKTPKVYSEKEIQCPKCPYTFRWKNDSVYNLCQIHKDYSGSLAKRAIRNSGDNIESRIKIVKVQGNVDESVISEWPETQELEKDAKTTNPNIDSCNFAESFHQEGESFHEVRSDWKQLENMNGFVTKRKETQSHKVTKSQSLKCRFGGEVLSTVELRVAHEKSHTPERRYECEICLKTFKAKHGLDQHKPVHTGERRFKCSECPGAFTQKGGLTSHHKRVHLKEKNFSCDYCEKRFACNTGKKLHMRTHFNEKPYQCEECGKNFTTIGGLSFHKLHHTQTKRHSCKICQKSFYTTVDLRHHMPVHTKEKLFQCTVCQSKFTTPKHVRRHMKLHTGEKNYVCTICKKAFAQRTGLNLHMKSHGVVRNCKEIVADD